MTQKEVINYTILSAPTLPFLHLDKLIKHPLKLLKYPIFYISILLTNMAITQKNVDLTLNRITIYNNSFKIRQNDYVKNDIKTLIWLRNGTKNNNTFSTFI